MERLYSLHQSGELGKLGAAGNTQSQQSAPDQLQQWVIHQDALGMSPNKDSLNQMLNEEKRDKQVPKEGLD